MPDARDDLRRQLNEMQAVDGIDSETREIIGILSATIRTLGEEIDDLQERVAELEATIDDNDQRKRMWYSERDSSE